MHTLYLPHDGSCDCLECQVRLLDRRLVAAEHAKTVKPRKPRATNPRTLPLLTAQLSADECISQLDRRARGGKIGNIGLDLVTSTLYYLRNPGEIPCKKKPKS